MMEIRREIDRNNSIYYKDAIYCLFGRFHRLTGMISSGKSKDKISTYDVIILP